MQYNNQIYEKMKIKSIRLRIALLLNVTEQAVIKAIKLRRQVLLAYPVVQLLKRELNLNESELFERLENNVEIEIISKDTMDSENKPTQALFQEPAFPQKKLSKQEKEQIIFKIKNDRLKKIK